MPSLEEADAAPVQADLETVPADPIHHLAAPQWDETPVAHADGAPSVHPTSGDAETVTESLTPTAPGHPTAADDDTLAWVEDDLWVTDHWQAEEFRQALLDGTPETGVPDAYGWAQFDDPSPRRSRPGAACRGPDAARRRAAPDGSYGAVGRPRARAHGRVGAPHGSRPAHPLRGRTGQRHPGVLHGASGDAGLSLRVAPRAARSAPVDGSGARAHASGAARAGGPHRTGGSSHRPPCRRP